MSKTTTLQRAIPGLGYAVALGFGAAAEGAFMARWGRVGQELTWFALVPALLAVVHLLAPKNARGGPLFGALGLIWAAAALSGLLARWEPLGEVSPLLSLARYALIALAGTLFCISVIMGGPLFVTAKDGRGVGVRLLFGLLGIALLFAWFIAIGLIVRFTPFPLALAPNERGLQVRRVWQGGGEEYLVWLAWSPDGTRLVGQAQGIWVLTPEQQAAQKISDRGMVFLERPWSERDNGFFYIEQGAQEGVWFSTPAGELEMRVPGPWGPPSCSPQGDMIAFAGSAGLFLASPDGSQVRLLSDEGAAPRWSPDGRKLLVVRRQNGLPSFWIVEPEGEARRLPIPLVELNQIAWAGPDKLATIIVRNSRNISLLGVRQIAEVTLWNLDGEAVRRFNLGGYLGKGGGQLAACGQGRRLAIALDMVSPFGSTLLTLDTQTGGIRRLPASVEGVSGLAWSVDGRNLALSDLVEECQHDHDHHAHDNRHSYVLVISGFPPSAD